MSDLATIITTVPVKTKTGEFVAVKIVDQTGTYFLAIDSNGNIKTSTVGSQNQPLQQSPTYFNLLAELASGGTAYDARQIRYLNSATDSVGVTFPSGMDVSDRAARLLGIVYGSLGQQLLQRASTYELLAALRYQGSEIDPRSIRALSSSTDSISAVISSNDVSDRAARLLGVVYGSQAQQLLQRTSTYDLLVALRYAGSEIDPRAIRALTSADVISAAQSGAWSVGVNNLPSDYFKSGQNIGNTGFNVNNWPSTYDVSDRAARQLGIIYGSVGSLLQRASTGEILAALRYAGSEIDPRSIRALTSSDVVDVYDRAARLLGIVYGSQSQQLLQRASTYDLLVALRYAGSEIDPRSIRALTSADVVTANAGTNLNTSLLALEAGGNLASIAGKDFATQATLALIKAKTDNLDTALSGIKAKTDNLDLALSARTLTKHDNTTYYSTNSVSLAASGTLLAAQASNKIRIHSIWGQAAASVEGNIQDGSGGTNMLHFKFNDREGFLLPFSPSPAFWGQNAAVNTALYITFTTAGQSYWTMIYSLV